MPKLYKAYITFGPQHKHIIDDVVLDVNCVAVINVDHYSDGTKKVKELFGEKYSMYYFDKDFPLKYLEYFPRGLINLNI